MFNTKAQPKINFSTHISRFFILWIIYLLVAIVLTWPAITHLSTHLPGDGGDDPAIAWNLWWIKHALLSQAQNPFYTDYMFYPIGINLAFYTLTVLNSVTALPLTLNFGVVTASNLHMLFTFVVGGYGAFLLIRYVLTTALTQDAGRRTDDRQGNHPQGRPALSLPNESAVSHRFIWLTAAIAGGFYAFASSKLFYVALGQFNIASNHWIPFAVLYLIRSHHQPRRLKNPLLAGLFLTLQAWAEITYASFLLVFMALYWLYWLLTKGTPQITGTQIAMGRPNLIPHLKATLVMGVTFAIGITPILTQILPDMLAEGDFLVEGSGFADTFSADLFGFIIPTMHHPWLGYIITQTHIGQPDSVTGFDKGQHIYIGVVLLGLLAVATLTQFRRPQFRFWLLAAALFALLSLGPVIIVNGYPTGIKGPFTLLQSLPFFKGNRYPSRYSVTLILSLSVIAGFGLLKIIRWTSRHRSWTSTKSCFFLTLIALLFLFEHLSLPLPQSDMRPPDAYQIIAADPSDFTVLDIPFAWRNGFRITGAPTTQFMFGQFYQTRHQKKLLQGNTSRNPKFKFQYFTNAPAINSLLAMETGQTLPPERWDADKAIATEVLRFFNIKYIVVRPYNFTKWNGTQNITVTHQAILPYIENVFPVEKIHDEAAIKVYRIRQTDFNPRLQVNTDSPLAPLYFGEGWGLLNPGRPLVAQRQRARLLLPLSQGEQHVSLRMRLPDGVNFNAQTVSLEVNGWHAEPQPMTTEWQTHAFALPPNLTKPGLNDVYLNFNQTTFLPLPALHTPSLDVTVISAGEEVGGFGHIFVNGHDVSANQRGYNVAIIAQNRAITTVHFDTHLDALASAALANFIATAPQEALIAVAAADEASQNLSAEAVQALHTIGATGDLRGCFRCSHAFIKVNIPNEGVLEALDPLRPAGVTTNLGLTEPTVAAVVDWIRVEPKKE